MSNAPIKTQIVGKTGFVQDLWALFFSGVADVVNAAVPLPLKSYVVSGLPPAAPYVGHIVYVSNESGGATVAFSDGTNWRRVQDRAIVT